MTTVTPVLLLILDGFGHRTEGDDNAIIHAHMPHWNQLCKQYPYTTINASEHYVGLPDGQFGNSEVGHINIGAGRLVAQDIVRINTDVTTGRLGQNPILAKAIATARDTGKTLHVLGLLSDGGVHSHEDHIHALVRAAHAAGVKRIAIHAILDGRDTPPRSAERNLQRMQQVCDACAGAQIVSVVGRFFALDRDHRWDRIEQAYRLIVEGRAPFQAKTALEALNAAYVRGEDDEFVLPTKVSSAANADTENVGIEDGDVVVTMHFRADRVRELTDALNEETFSGFVRYHRPKLAMYATLTRYAEHYPYPVAYDKETIKQSFGEVISRLGLKQLRVAETEKYPHVTYFFSGGQEPPFPGEDRVLVPSPSVATYDQRPEMSAMEITDKIVMAIAAKKYAAIICNFANGDMVGHSGNFNAAVAALEALDICIGRCVAAMQAAGGEVLITADHGNCEQMWDKTALQPHTQHTISPVPFLYIGRPATVASPNAGALKDIAPSLLAMMNLPQPPEMTGHSLIQFSAG